MRLFPPFAVVLNLCVLSSALSQPDFLIKKEIGQQLSRLDNALASKDFKKAKTFVEPDAVWITDTRTDRFDGMVSAYRKQISRLDPSIQYTSSIGQFQVKGVRAVFTRTLIISGVYHEGKKLHQTFDGSAWQDVWIKTASGWKLKSTEMLRHDAPLLDGVRVRGTSPWVKTNRVTRVGWPLPLEAPSRRFAGPTGAA